jgi:hypothetical protein
MRVLVDTNSLRRVCDPHASLTGEVAYVDRAMHRANLDRAGCCQSNFLIAFLVKSAQNSRTLAARAGSRQIGPSFFNRVRAATV